MERVAAISYTIVAQGGLTADIVPASAQANKAVDLANAAVQ